MVLYSSTVAVIRLQQPVVAAAAAAAAQCLTIAQTNLLIFFFFNVTPLGLPSEVQVTVNPSRLVTVLDWPLCHCAMAQAPPFYETKPPLSKKCIPDCVGHSTNHLYFNVL